MNPSNTFLIQNLFTVILIKVFSDEFNQDGRSFSDGEDPRWTAIEKNDCTFIQYDMQG